MNLSDLTLAEFLEFRESVRRAYGDDAYGRLTLKQHDLLLADILAIYDEPVAGFVDQPLLLDCPAEHARRVGGAKNLQSYVACLEASGRRAVYARRAEGAL